MPQFYAVSRLHSLVDSSVSVLQEVIGRRLYAANTQEAFETFDHRGCDMQADGVEDEVVEAECEHLA